MKKVIISSSIMTVLVLALATVATAAVPQTISYQGRLTDDQGAVTDVVSITFTIYDAPTNGNSKWSETHPSVSVVDGIFNVVLGAGMPPVPIDDTVFSGQDRWLEINVGGETITPRTKLASNPYSFQGNWNRVGDVLYTSGEWGIARAGNTLYGNGRNSHVNLGSFNTTGQSGQNRYQCTVGGGNGNLASAGFSTVGGGGGNIASGECATVGGGQINVAGPSGYATVGGGLTNSASGSGSTVGGGSDNQASADYSTVGGGSDNHATAGHCTVGGGGSNYAYGESSTVGGGSGNNANGEGSTIGGGNSNTASGDSSTVAGGAHNTASSVGSFVGGGYSNAANSWASVVSGGDGNTASGGGSFVGGGYSNNAGGTGSSIGGGASNNAGGIESAIAGGSTNTAAGEHSSVGGGENNKADNNYAMVPGGSWCHATGRFSFAAGRRAKANHDGAFVWADTTDADFSSTYYNQFLIRADGGVGIGTDSPQGALDVSSTTGAFIVPRMTTTQRNALTAVNGMIIYNTTTNQFNFYENSAWVTK